MPIRCFSKLRCTNDDNLLFQAPKDEAEDIYEIIEDIARSVIASEKDKASVYGRSRMKELDVISERSERHY